MSPSLEQYIEAIADLLTRDKVCSVSDIAAQVQVSRPAVSRAVRELSEQKLVTHKAYGYVDLTEKGQQIADRFLETTILFADLAGFTQWSSAREPEHVFELLEALYVSKLIWQDVAGWNSLDSGLTD